MSTSILLNFDPHAILPKDTAFIQKHRTDRTYYSTLAFIASLVRDKHAACSIYIDDPYEDYIEEYLNNDVFDDTARHTFQHHLPAIIKCAEVMDELMPEGIFEQLTFKDVLPRGIVFTGVLHETDYR